MSIARLISRFGLKLNTNGFLLPEALANGGAEFGSNNILINGNLDNWQRGTSLSNWGSFSYLNDRMRIGYDGTPANGRTLTRQTFAAGQTDVPEGDPQYYMEYAFPACGTPTNYLRWDIESVRTLQSKKATFSFWARVPSGTMTIGAAIAQEFGSGGSPSAGVYPAQTNYTITSSWSKIVYTQLMPSISGKIIGTNGDDRIWPGVWMPTNAAGTIQFANFKLEEGDTATRFNRRSLGLELSLAQRYFWSGTATLYGFNYDGGNVPKGDFVAFPVTMRAAPTVSIGAAAFNASYTNNPYAAYVSNNGFVYGANVTANATYASSNYVTANAEM